MGLTSEHSSPYPCCFRRGNGRGRSNNAYHENERVLHSKRDSHDAHVFLHDDVRIRILHVHVNDTHDVHDGYELSSTLDVRANETRSNECHARENSIRFRIWKSCLFLRFRDDDRSSDVLENGREQNLLLRHLPSNDKAVRDTFRSCTF